MPEIEFRLWGDFSLHLKMRPMLGSKILQKRLKILEYFKAMTKYGMVKVTNCCIDNLKP